MTGNSDTIVALSTGNLPSGVAVIRFSGSRCKFVVEKFVGDLPEPQRLVLRKFFAPCDGVTIDEGLVVWFAAPRSFTGEDCAEFHIHGSQAVVARFLNECETLEGVRLALAGEFVQRAFEAGRLNALEVEGIADLLAARTESQRHQAVAQMSGKSSDQLFVWRDKITDLRAHIEACLDFSDEEDVPNELPDVFEEQLSCLIADIAGHIQHGHVGEMVREGVVVAIVGKPNVGKSSLLNELAERDVAIVNAEAGTTRDLLQVDLDIGGYAFQVVDSAGLRQANSEVEIEGIRRARGLIQRADVVLYLDDSGKFVEDFQHDEVWRVLTKVDLVSAEHLPFDCLNMAISCRENVGMDALLDRLAEFAKRHIGAPEHQVVTRQRHLSELRGVIEALNQCSNREIPLEIRAEMLREASNGLGRIVGAVDVEDVLDRLFAGFCIGK